jgi:hypothetical protein
LDVIKLPKPISDAKAKLPDFLFVRLDEYCIIRCLMDPGAADIRGTNNLMIGNPGILKSWLHYKIILFSVLQDLVNVLWKKFILNERQVSCGWMNEPDEEAASKPRK